MPSELSVHVLAGSRRGASKPSHQTLILEELSAQYVHRMRPQRALLCRFREQPVTPSFLVLILTLGVISRTSMIRLTPQAQAIIALAVAFCAVQVVEFTYSAAAWVLLYSHIIVVEDKNCHSGRLLHTKSIVRNQCRVRGFSSSGIGDRYIEWNRVAVLLRKWWLDCSRRRKLWALRASAAWFPARNVGTVRWLLSDGTPSQTLS